MKRLIGMIAATMCAASAFSWFDTGHMVVAEIAYRRLDPDVRNICNDLLKSGKFNERNGDFRTSAAWADDFKTRENGVWHYINFYFREDGGKAKGKPLEENVVWAINRFERVVADKSAKPEDRADALRFLIHFVGDVHQPLHSTARECEDHPNGDRGGNDFKITSPKSINPPVNNLHFLWDSGAGYFPQVVRPLNETGQRTLARLADEIERSLPFDQVKDQLSKTDPNAWALESFEIAKSKVYELKEGEEPGQNYLSSAQATCKQRVALAGYRLAGLLNRALTTRTIK